MNQPLQLTYESIRNLRHSMQRDDPFFKPVDLMWQAMTDWVTYVKNCEVFLAILHEEVKNELTQENLEHHKPSVSGPHWAWKMETLLDLNALFDCYPGLNTLEEVFLAFCEELINRDDFVWADNDVAD